MTKESIEVLTESLDSSAWEELGTEEGEEDEEDDMEEDDDEDEDDKIDPKVLARAMQEAQESDFELDDDAMFEIEDSLVAIFVRSANPTRQTSRAPSRNSKPGSTTCSASSREDVKIPKKSFWHSTAPWRRWPIAP